MSASVMDKILITGANGNLGKKLLLQISELPVRALVRSKTAQQNLQDFVDQKNLSNVEVVQCDYNSVDGMTQAITDCSYVVHLVGIIKESQSNSFYHAHEQSMQVLCQVLEKAPVKRVFYLSLLGSNTQSKNACLSSRGNAEQILVGAATDSVLVRVPMVLGEGDYASHALRKQSTKRFSFSFRAASLEQPIYAADVLAAIVMDIKRCQAGDKIPQGIVELAGPESLTRAALRQRANACLGQTSSTISLPLILGYTMAALLQRILGNPPVTPAMLGVLDHDDNIDPKPASSALAIQLTSLDEMLAKTLRT